MSTIILIHTINSRAIVQLFPGYLSNLISTRFDHDDNNFVFTQGLQNLVILQLVLMFSYLP